MFVLLRFFFDLVGVVGVMFVILFGLCCIKWIVGIVVFFVEFFCLFIIEIFVLVWCFEGVF